MEQDSGKGNTFGDSRERYGYTTGTCAAAAAKAAAGMLLCQKMIREVPVLTPGGTLLHLEVEEPSFSREEASCCVIKDAGSDPDVTDGMRIGASVRKNPNGSVVIDGGEGIGRVTRPGLDQPVGNAAINHVPRQMIEEAVSEACADADYEGGMDVLIFAPEGRLIAEKTFNPRLGIVGGISILGTSGIVEPMSQKALIESIRLEMRQQKAMGAQYELLVPGNYGENFVKETFGPQYHPVQFSNFVGEAADEAVRLSLKGILFAAHIGKFVKVSGGIMNTHSAEADCRMELLAAAAIREKASVQTAERVLSCLTTEEALDVLGEAGILQEVCDNLLQRILFYLNRRVQGCLEIGVVLYSSRRGLLARSDNTKELLEKLQRK